MASLTATRGTLTLLLAIASAVPVWAGLRWEQSSITVDAGPFDEAVTGVFTFTNTGEQPITISSVESTCGCTVPELDKKSYAPGEQGKLRAVFTFSGREGLQVKHISVTTDDPTAPRTELTLAVNIPKLFAVEPRFVVWRKEQSAEPKTISIQVLKPDVVQLTEVECPDKRFTTKLDPVAETPGAFVLTITPQQMAEEAQATVTVKTNAPEDTPRVITIYALIR